MDGSAKQEAVRQVESALEAALGTPCELFSFPRPTDLAFAYRHEAVDLAWVSPTLALQSSAFLRAEPVAVSVRSGRPHYHGVIFVRRDSPIRSPLALRGKTVAWVAPTSASGYIFPRVALAELGLDPEELFDAESFAGTHERVAEMVRSGEVACGAGFAHFEGGDCTRRVKAASYFVVGDDSEFRILVATPAIPADIFMARPQLVARGASDALLRAAAAEPDAFRQLFGVDALASADVRDIEQIRKGIMAAEQLGVLAPVHG